VVRGTNVQGANNISKIELAKGLKAIRGIVPDEAYERIKRSLVPEEASEEVEKAISGLSEEDEFALLCRLMGTATHLVGLEQRPLVPGDAIVPDFLARFQPGCSIEGREKTKSSGFKCLVDVKSTTKLRYKIGGSLLARRRKFAATFDLPLLFAVRFLRFGNNAYWVIIHDTDWQRRTLTVEVNEIFSGVRHVLWDEYWYMLQPGLYFECVFEKEHQERGVCHPEYGSQAEFRIIDRRRVIPLTGDSAAFYSAFFVPYDLKEAEVRRHGTKIVQTLVPQLSQCSIIDLVYNINRLPRDAKGRTVYDATKIVARSDTDIAKCLITRDTVEKASMLLQQAGLLHLIGIGEPGTHLKQWVQYGGILET
jgi:hypothetical protein